MRDSRCKVRDCLIKKKKTGQLFKKKSLQTVLYAPVIYSPLPQGWTLPVARGD